VFDRPKGEGGRNKRWKDGKGEETYALWTWGEVKRRGGTSKPRVGSSLTGRRRGHNGERLGCSIQGPLEGTHKTTLTERLINLSRKGRLSLTRSAGKIANPNQLLSEGGRREQAVGVRRPEDLLLFGGISLKPDGKKEIKEDANSNRTGGKV